MADISKMVSEKAVVIFSKSTCSSCQSIKLLFYNFGVSPLVYELDEIPNGPEIEEALVNLGRNPTVPVVYIGGELVGGAKEVITLHVTGALVEMLKKTGALHL